MIDTLEQMDEIAAKLEKGKLASLISRYLNYKHPFMLIRSQICNIYDKPDRLGELEDLLNEFTRLLEMVSDKNKVNYFLASNFEARLPFPRSFF